MSDKPNNANGSGEPNWNLNPIRLNNLYRQENYTDPEAGTLIEQIPILADGSRDPMRLSVWGASCTLNIQGRQVPIQFPIPNVWGLAEAVEAFPDALRAAVKHMHDQAVRQQLMAGMQPGQRPALDLSKLRGKG